MNNRAITHNDQLDQIIGALQPKTEKPDPLSATWPVLHKKAMETARIANQHPWVEEPPSDMGFFISVVGVGLILLFMCRYLERNSNK